MSADPAQPPNYIREIISYLIFCSLARGTAVTSKDGKLDRWYETVVGTCTLIIIIIAELEWWVESHIRYYWGLIQAKTDSAAS